jgi:inhibitor of cysteine peptidase
MKNCLHLFGLGLLLLALCWSPGVTLAGNLQPQRIKTYTQLKKLLKQHQPRYYTGFRTGLTALANDSGGNVRPGTASPGGSSQTLVQVAGVDEGDEVKNDDTYIYQLNQDRVFIILANPDSALSLVATLDFSTNGFYPQELYLDGQQLIVIGTSFHDPYPYLRRGAMPIRYFSTSTVQAKVYDVTNPAVPRKVRELEIDGDYVATRKVGSTLYLVSRQYPDFYATGLSSGAKLRLATPSFRDSRRGKTFRVLSPANCWYFPGFDDPNYLIVGGVDLSTANSTLQVTAYLGAGDQVYASTNNLYVTSSRWLDLVVMGGATTLANSSAVSGAPTASKAAGLASTIIPAPVPPIPPQAVFPSEKTDIYKFSLNKGQPRFAAAAEVPGTILNSYAMDENGDYFRLATTRRGSWFDESLSSNAVYVLDAALNLAGKVENVAPGEQIYAARFMGTRLFLVTYEQIDPLFAIDLSDPANPLVVGQLALPGYSSFLLPYDENHLIGLGKDVTVVTNTTDGDVPWWSGGAFYQGLRLSLFDVTDLHQPALVQSISIGDRGSDSPALWDPHAVLWDSSSHLLAFPVTVASATNADPADPWQWGDPVFQGAYVFDVSADTGFSLRGTVTQISAGTDIWSAWDQQIQRVMHIGSDLYTLSSAEVQACDLATLEPTATLNLPTPNWWIGPGGPITVQPVTSR